MYFYSDIYQDLRKIGIRENDTILMHSSMKSVGEVDGGAKTVIDALKDTLRNGMLVLPTHTWATVNEEHPLYDPDKEPACVGILPNLFLKEEGVFRSLHPTHSLAAWSADELECKDKMHTRAYQFVQGEEAFETPCNRKGCYGKLYDMDAKILLMGVGLNKNTFMHGVEEWFGISERLTKETLALEIRMPDGSNKSVAMHKHYKPKNISISENYTRMYQPFLEEGAMQIGKIGDADCMLIQTQQMTEIVNRYLSKDRNYFLHGLE